MFFCHKSIPHELDRKCERLGSKASWNGKWPFWRWFLDNSGGFEKEKTQTVKEKLTNKAKYL